MSRVESLAIRGGAPVRTEGWPLFIPGGSTYDEGEKEAAIEVINSQSPFRYYGCLLYTSPSPRD